MNDKHKLPLIITIELQDETSIVAVTELLDIIAKQDDVSISQAAAIVLIHAAQNYKRSKAEPVDQGDVTNVTESLYDIEKQENQSIR